MKYSYDDENLDANIPIILLIIFAIYAIIHYYLMKLLFGDFYER